MHKVDNKDVTLFTSVMGLDARTLSSTRVVLPDLLTTAKYLMAYRADTVLPAPDSPLTIIDWFLWFLIGGHGVI